MFLPTASYKVNLSVITNCYNDTIYQLFCCIPSYQLDHIQSLLIVAAKIVYGRECFIHVIPLLKDRLRWLHVPQRIDFKHCLLVYYTD